MNAPIQNYYGINAIHDSTSLNGEVNTDSEVNQKMALGKKDGLIFYNGMTQLEEVLQKSKRKDLELPFGVDQMMSIKIDRKGSPQALPHPISGKVVKIVGYSVEVKLWDTSNAKRKRMIWGYAASLIPGSLKTHAKKGTYFEWYLNVLSDPSSIRLSKRKFGRVSRVTFVGPKGAPLNLQQMIEFYTQAYFRLPVDMSHFLVANGKGPIDYTDRMKNKILSGETQVQSVTYSHQTKPLTETLSKDLYTLFQATYCIQRTRNMRRSKYATSSLSRILNYVFEVKENNYFQLTGYYRNKFNKEKITKGNKKYVWDVIIDKDTNVEEAKKYRLVFKITLMRPTLLFYTAREKTSNNSTKKYNRANTLSLKDLLQASLTEDGKVVHIENPDLGTHMNCIDHIIKGIYEHDLKVKFLINFDPDELLEKLKNIVNSPEYKFFLKLWSNSKIDEDIDYVKAGIPERTWRRYCSLLREAGIDPTIPLSMYGLIHRERAEAFLTEREDIALSMGYLGGAFDNEIIRKTNRRLKKARTIATEKYLNDFGLPIGSQMLAVSWVETKEEIERQKIIHG